MNSFFIEFRDPLFGIIVFFALIFAITFISYWWGRYKSKENFRDLDKFLKQFRSVPSQKELISLINKGNSSEKSWLLLANAYVKNGDYEKSIDIYNEILKYGEEFNSKETMFLLGQTYFKAGFLERAKQIFLEILKNNPRTPEVLRALLLVYEYMRDYNSALDILESLDELKKDIITDSAYLKTLFILNDTDISTDEKVNKLLEIYQVSNKLTHMIFEYIFRVNPSLAWENFDKSKAEFLIDILWQVDKKDLDLDIITQNGYLVELYTARGDIELAKSSDVFEFDILINLNNKPDVTLSFEYLCNCCHRVYPFAFNRCSFCHSIDTPRIELNLVKNYHRGFGEDNNSFQ